MAQQRKEILKLMAGAPRLVSALKSLEEAGHQAHLVGGSVRDALMGKTPSDFDISTSAHPEVVAEIFAAQGRSVHPTGIEHGTQTVVIDEEPFEITTWRRDVATDGRRATIQFADRLEDDAERRDFTVNALYAAADGTVVDPTGRGLADAAARRISFVGDAETRIKEDHLRILRFYRFAASHGCGRMPAEDLAACEAHAGLVASLPKERIGAEMLKLVCARDAAGSLEAMQEADLTRTILPGMKLEPEILADRLGRAALQERMLGLAPCPIRRLGVLVDAAPQAELKLSNRDTKRFEQIHAAAQSDAGPAEIGYRFGAEIGEEALVNRYARGQDEAATAQALAQMRHGAEQVFPVKAADLMDRFKGKALGDELRRQEAQWIAGGFPNSRKKPAALEID